MSNTLGNGYLNSAIWAAMMQPIFYKESVALALASTAFEDQLYVGDTVHYPYSSYPRVQSYTKGTDITVKDLSGTDETMTVSTTKVASFYIDDVDKIQNAYDVMNTKASEAMRQLNTVLDQAVMAEYSNAEKTLDDGDMGGTSGSAISVSQSNISNIFTAANRVLIGKKRISPNRFAIIGPRMLETIQLYVGGRETIMGDRVGDNGYVADRFGFKLYVSNNLYYSATMTISVQPTDGDSVTINGVTFTFRDALTGSSTLGEVLIGGSAANANSNLAKAINDGGTVDTNYSALSAENRQFIEESGLAGTATATTTAITGYGDIVVSKSMTSGSNVWGSQLSYPLMGIQGAINLLVQKAPNVEIKDAPLRLGKYVHPWMLYGKKTFARNKGSLVAAKCDASSWV